MLTVPAVRRRARSLSVIVFIAVLIGSLALPVFVVPLTGEAQQAAKTPRVGMLTFNSIDAARPLLDAFGQALREREWVEGRNVVIEYRSAERKQDRIPHVVAELINLKVDVIVAGSTVMALGATRATRTIPIVMTAVDPVGMGLVPNLARPGGNITGVTNIAPEMGSKQLGFLKEIRAGLSRVAVLVNPNNTGTPLFVREAQAVAPSLGLRLQTQEVRDPGEFDGAFSAVTGNRAEGLLVQADALFFGQGGRRIAQLAAKHKLPAIYSFREPVDAGGLMSYGANVPELYRRMALYVDKILRGARPGDLPIEQPTKFELVINRKTAKTLGLTIPPSVLVQADHLIE